MARAIIILILVSYVVETKQVSDNEKIRIVIRSDEIFLNDIKQSLGKYLFYFESKINGHLFIFVKKTEEPNRLQLSSNELAALQRSNQNIEKLDQSYSWYPESPLKPHFSAYGSDVHRTEQGNARNFMHLCPPYFDQSLGIDQSWIEHNVSGRGIVVGVTDVGINASNTCIRGNIKFDLSYNFVDNITQTSPSVFPNILESSLITGHAIACAGLVARPMTVDECVFCGVGVAHESKVADLQIAKVKENSWMFPVIDSAIYSRALAFRRDAIHIFSNSWAAKLPFKKLNFYEEDVLTEGVKEGRHGLGTLYVFPAGQPGSGFANHIGSITVACLAVNGTVDERSAVNAAALVSVFCSGRKRNDQRMITVGLSDKRCDTTFGGESAATAIVSGMIALLLESNPRLSVRDVKHILIESSSHLWIEASPEFVPNTAGKYYHPRLGFGLPDSLKMVLLGRRWNQLAQLCKSTLIFSKDAYHLKDLHWYLRVLYDNTFCDTTPCIEKMEEVLFDIEFVYSEQHHMKLWAKSPNDTKSTLAEMKPVANGDKAKRVNTRFRSNHFWGENSEGRWHIYIGCNLPMSDPFPAYGCHVTKARLTIHGTVEKANAQQHCNADTLPDDDRNKLPSVTSDGKRVEHKYIITNNFVTNNINNVIIIATLIQGYGLY